MSSLSALERAVLLAIAEQAQECGAALREQIAAATVADRENTGVGFYTRLAVPRSRRVEAAASPLGDIGAQVDGLQHGMGFLLWLKNGLADTLEGYTYDEATEALDFAGVRYSAVGPRLDDVR